MLGEQQRGMECSSLKVVSDPDAKASSSQWAAAPSLSEGLSMGARAWRSALFTYSRRCRSPRSSASANAKKVKMTCIDFLRCPQTQSPGHKSASGLRLPADRPGKCAYYNGLRRQR